MANGLVGHGVLGEEVADHVSLNLHGVPVLATIDVNDGSAHLGDDNAVSEVSFNTLGLLSGGAVLLGLSKLLDQSVVLGVHAVLESSSLSGVHHGNDLLSVHLEELIKLVTSPDLLLKWLLHFWLFGHLVYSKLTFI
eukprot:CAMPEP_0170490402 /NCGR_PEP_ID=MMETSP0208-20121228/8588_1 /TAXON_ID=197538 /ORGANISM="Strombidium inclinatum, Strain S3" /LENGTH=136 /DNA_ID=CAMNT_0010765753 /DNA_START=189 /DNA_END=599 /DNA_ORIENTATION=-